MKLKFCQSRRMMIGCERPFIGQFAVIRRCSATRLFPLRNVFPPGSVSVQPATRQQASTTATVLLRAIVTSDPYSIRLRMPEPGPKEAFLRLCIAGWSRASDTIEQLGPLLIDSAV